VIFVHLLQSVNPLLDVKEMFVFLQIFRNQHLLVDLLFLEMVLVKKVIVQTYLALFFQQ
jgi:hypothetical protein